MSLGELTDLARPAVLTAAGYLFGASITLFFIVVACLFRRGRRRRWIWAWIVFAALAATITGGVAFGLLPVAPSSSIFPFG
ncbi:MAG: hypothetical protein OXI95_12035 [bacterium]|nr:hypothetical protein [bacterium]